MIAARLPDEPDFALRLPFTILVVEDNPVNQKLILLLLAKLGYRADTAANGLEAVRSLQRQAYDVVFMNVYMPGMDGIEATRRIQKISSENERPWIVALTSDAMQSDRDICLGAGMRDVVTKPVQMADLRKSLLNVQRRADPDLADLEEWAIPVYLIELLDEMGADLLQLFIEDSTKQMSELEAALSEESLARAARILHSLKGSCAQMGASRMVKLCVQAEAGTKSSGLAAGPRAIAGLKPAHKNLIARMRECSARLRSNSIPLAQDS
jgi:CheY-like chemotaxis protein